MRTPRLFKTITCIIATLFFYFPIYAWGSEGHAIIGEIAFKFLNDNTKKNIEYYLDSMSIEDACNWMDDERNNPDYNFMKPWHYLDIQVDENYVPSTDENIINEIIISFNELRHKKTLCDEQIKSDLLVLCHLIGDLHQPLHTGYPNDRGGNDIQVQYLTRKTNLHHVWDSDIIESENITMDDCLQLYNGNDPQQYDTIKGIHFVSWMKESRTILKEVYNFKDSHLDKKYVERNKPIIERQLLIAGIRLAAVLNKLFDNTAPEIKTGQKNVSSNIEINISDAPNYVGKDVIVCSHVFGVKSTGKINLIDLGARYPNSLLTIVIFARDQNKFNGNIANLFGNKDICVNGKIVEYRGKEEIIVTDPNEIKVTDSQP